MKPVASIIIVVKNDLGIENTLHWIFKQNYVENIEVIVIDASPPEKLAKIRSRSPRALWEMFDQKGKRYTIAEQRNIGMERAHGDVLVFIDANCVPVESWLASLLAAIHDGEDIVCGPCRPSNANNLVKYIQEHKARSYISECTTINVAFRKKVFRRIGTFDTALECGEDVDYFWRAVDAGYKICFEPSAVISHYYGGPAEQIRRAYRYGKYRALLHYKYRRTRFHQLLRYEPHVWVYPLFILSLPLVFLWPEYLLILLVPIIKNRSVSVVLHHLIFGSGVLVGFTRAITVHKL